MNLIFFDLLASRINIQADYNGEWPKITSPLLKRAAFTNPDLENGYMSIAKPLKMSLVNRKILIPFMSAAVVFIQEIPEKRHRRDSTNRTRLIGPSPF